MLCRASAFFLKQESLQKKFRTFHIMEYIILWMDIFLSSIIHLSYCLLQNFFFFFSFLISFGPLIESVSLRKIMFYKVPEFPDKMSTDHEDQVLGKQRPGWQNGPRRGPDIDWDAGP